MPLMIKALWGYRQFIASSVQREIQTRYRASLFGAFWTVLKRTQSCKKIIGLNSFIKVKFYENIIKSNKTIDLINYLKKNKNFEIYFLMGADNLINFHRWHKSKLISQKCNIVVFDRHGYKKNSLKSKTFKKLNNKTLTFVEFKKVNISSSQLRKI